MTSYQRRKREILYYKQCIEDLEHIAKELAKLLRKHSIPIPLLSQPISGDTIITFYSDEFLSFIIDD